MARWFPADCGLVSGRFRNTTFIWLLLRLLRFAPRSLAACRPDGSFDCCASLRAHSRPVAPMAPSTAALRSALTRGLSPRWLLRLLRFAPRSLAACRPDGSFDCCASLRAHSRPVAPMAPSTAALRSALTRGLSPRWLLRLLRFAPRSLAGCRPDGSFDCCASLRAHSRAVAPMAPSTAALRSALTRGLSPRLLLRLVRFAPRSLPGCRPWLLLCLLRFAPRSLAGCRPDCSPTFRFAPHVGAGWCADCSHPDARAEVACMARQFGPSYVRARFHKRRDRDTLAGAAAHGWPCPLRPFLTRL